MVRQIVRAYVWMDLAAERNYRQLVALREHYWLELGEQERERALAIGPDLYREYGDAVAVPRMDRLLNEARRNITGSRVGSLTAPMEVRARTEGGEFMRFAGDKYYRRQYWDPKLYHQWKDEFFENPFNGEVDVGELRMARVAYEQGR
ncbi:MAG: hypothetical protein IPK97_12695 [Ahniella sp.]|nr:hypothetical protein [Ahniella sp.]